MTIQKIQAGTPTSLVATFGQTYTYDKMNRITQVSESSSVAGSTPWTVEFGYDGFGNRAVAGPSLDQTTATATSQYNVLTNRQAKDSGNQTMPADAYDAAGNLTHHPYMSGLMAYDAEDRLKSMGGTSFVYDGQGQRVQKTSSSGTTTYVYDAQGGVAAEYGSAAGTSCTTCYLTADPLGSTRLVTDVNGVVKQRRDYHPFGEEILANATFGNRPVVTDGGTATTYNASNGPTQEFTGKERDAETGLDYFGARYMSSAQGRFTSTDPKAFSKATIQNPQKWNKYSYTLNNPLALVDPDGKEEIKVTIRAFIPESSFKFPPLIGPTWHGDGRTFDPNATSYRAQGIVTIETDPRVSANPVIGSSKGTSGSAVNWWGLGSSTASADVKLSAVGVRDEQGNPVVYVKIGASDPLVPGAPQTTGSFTITAPSSGGEVSVKGAVDLYPSWEVYGQNKGSGAVPIIQQGTTLNSPAALAQPIQSVVQGTANLTPKSEDCKKTGSCQ